MTTPSPAGTPSSAGEQPPSQGQLPSQTQQKLRVDLTGQGASEATAPPETIRKGDVTDRREFVRYFITLGILFIFAGTIAGGFAGAMSSHWDNVKSLLDLLVPAETAALGTLVAFYVIDS